MPDYVGALERPLGPLGVGVSENYYFVGVDPEIETAVREALRMMEDLGASRTKEKGSR